MNFTEKHLSFVNDSLPIFNNISLKSQELNAISLIDYIDQFKMFDHMPKLFKIINKDQEYFFNVNILADVSSVIERVLENDPQQLYFQLNIDDERNILKKIEFLLQGNSVSFDTNDFSSCSKLLNILKIHRFPINQLINIDDYHSLQFTYQKSEIRSMKFRFSTDDLQSFLKRKAPHSFTISTNKKEYKCNSFGILSSSIIQELISKNPQINRFEYDFADENNEFQIICDLFNFEQILITRKNEDILFQFAKDLKIDCIMEKIEKHIDDHYLMNDKLDEQQNIVDLVEDLFEWLYNIKIITFEKVKELIIDSIWIETTENIQELIAIILQVVNIDYSLHPYIADLLVELNNNSNCKKLAILIPFLVEKLMDSFASSKKTCHFVYILNKHGIIAYEDLMAKITNIFTKSSNENEIECLKFWFLPELYAINPNFFYKFYNLKNNELTNINKFIPEKIDIYKEMRENGEPNDEITKALRNDDIESFQSLVSSRIDQISKFKIPFNLYEDYVPIGNCCYLDYAAAYGSIKCFKYLLLNHHEINMQTISYAVYGGNIEIIKIVNQKQISSFNVDFVGNVRMQNQYDSIIISIAKHKNELFDWIFEQKYFPKCDETSIFILIAMSVLYGNIHALTEIVDKTFDFANNPEFCNYLLQVSSRKGFLHMTKYLLYLMPQKLEISKINVLYINPYNNQSNHILFNNYLNAIQSFHKWNFSYETINCLLEPIDKIKFGFAVFYGNLSIFQLFEKLMNQNDLMEVINYAIEKNYNSIIIYFFNNTINKNGFQITDKFVSDALCISTKRKNKDLFELLIDKFKQINPEFLEEFNMNYNILYTACKYLNDGVAKYLIDFILENFYIDHNDNENLTVAFIEAMISGSYEICKYFIDKKIEIVFDEVIKNISKLDSINLEILMILLDSFLPYQKEMIVNKLINPAIIANNKSVIKYLLTKSPTLDYALLNAVNTHDVETVNIILEYNKDPLFINKVFEDGNVLQYAIYYKDFDIIKKLLSIPEIDVNVCHRNGKSLLIEAIYKGNDDLCILLAKHPRNNINFQDECNVTALSLAAEADFKNLVEILINHENFDPIKSRINHAFFYANYEIKKLLFSIKELDVNCMIDGYTTLTYAIKYNQSDSIDLIISHPSFDKSKSLLPIAITDCIMKNNMPCFSKLLKFVDNHDEISQSLSYLLSCNIENKYQIFKDICNYNEMNGKFIDFTKLLPNGKSFFTSIASNSQNIQEIVSLLLKNGANPNIPDKNGIYPLQYAIEINSIKFVQILINSQKVDFNTKIRIKRENISENLTDHQKDGSLKNNRKTHAKYKSYLHLAARSSNIAILDEFLDKKLIDINITDDLGETPLMEACRYFQFANIEHLFKFENLDFNLKNHKGEDALQIVSKNNINENGYEIRKNKDKYLEQCLLNVKCNILFEIA